MRAELPEPPPRIARLPLDPDRGYPVPWFVPWFDGKPDFRMMDEGKIFDALRFQVCWLCGERLGRNVAYVVGPMCAVNRVSPEPPSHRDCAIYAAQACPFLTRPKMRRRDGGLPEGVQEPAGIMLRRNPGVALVWVTHGVHFRHDVRLFNIGEPDETLWFAEGREATRAEIMASIDSGVPVLLEIAAMQGDWAVAEVATMTDAARELVPA